MGLHGEQPTAYLTLGLTLTWAFTLSGVGMLVSCTRYSLSLCSIEGRSEVILTVPASLEVAELVLVAFEPRSDGEAFSNAPVTSR